MVSWLQAWIRENKMKSLILVILFPVLLWVFIFLFFYFFQDASVSEVAMQDTFSVLAILIPVLLIWLVISFIYQRKLVFSYTWAKELQRKDNPQIYNIVENLCISRWLPTPKIGIMEDPWMNAFALWWKTKDSWIVFTRGLIDKLTPAEIEAVAGHELTHIMNKDCLLMLIIVLYIWGITFIGEWLFRIAYYWRTGSSKSRGDVLFYIWLILLALGYLCYPLIRLGISRKREFLADAWSVELRWDNLDMISALEKISGHSQVGINNSQMASMFIENPLNKISYLFQTHPSVEDRVKALRNYW